MATNRDTMGGDMNLTINETSYTDDKSGRLITRYTPVLKGVCTATGLLTFACWEVWTDEPIEAHTQAKHNAIDNVKQILSSISF
jgi:hypothetical protein